MNLHLEKLKIDSFKILLDADKIESNESSVGRLMTLIDEDGVVHKQKVQNSWSTDDSDLPRYKECKLGIRRNPAAFAGGKDDNGNPNRKETYSITVTAKMLLKKYFEGINKQNIELVYEFLQEMPNPLRFSMDSFMSAKVVDVDVCYDTKATPKEWKNLCMGIRDRTKVPAPTFRFDGKVYGTFITYWGDDEEKAVGITYMTREAAKLKKPHLKFYHKGLEFLGKGKPYRDLHFGNYTDDVFANVGRYELTLKDGNNWKQSNVIVNTVYDLVELDLDVIKDYTMKATLNFLQAPPVLRTKKGTPLREQNELWFLEKLIVAGMITEAEVISQIKMWGYEQGKQTKVVNEQCERIRNYFMVLRKDIEIQKRLMHNKKVRGLMDKFHIP